ncbi:MAG: transcriptional regulator [Gemmatimonadetes bacterium]|nr:transcriptional regulator [Gemmatimonadota bacterium]
MTVTIKDVARLASVSVATVSRVLNSSAPVSPDTRERVLQVARSLHFVPNGSARSLSRRRAAALGVILPDLYGEFFSELLRGIDQAAQRASHSLLVSSSHHDARGIGSAIRAMRGRVDGLLIMAPEVDAADVAEVLPADFPTVLINGAAASSSVQTITVDNFGGAQAMTEHLLSLGRRRIGFIAGAAHNADALERERGHHAALQSAGLPIDPELYVRGDFSEESGWQGAATLMGILSPPAAIFAANDAMAIGAISYLREQDITVPERMAVVGFDDIPVARYLNPSLTTVRVGIAALGQQATALLLDALDNRAPPTNVASRSVLPTHLVIRGSCGSPTSAPSRQPAASSTARNGFDETPIVSH